MNFLTSFRQEQRAEGRAMGADILVILIIVQFVLETAIAPGNLFSLLSAGIIVG